MTDADPRANDNAPRGLSAPHDLPESHDAAERGFLPGSEGPATPAFGGASAWPAWPGVARPAGWFLSAPGEAAPPGAPGSEPARPDTASADGDGADATGASAAAGLSPILDAHGDDAHGDEDDP